MVEVGVQTFDGYRLPGGQIQTKIDRPHTALAEFVMKLVAPADDRRFVHVVLQAQLTDGAGQPLRSSPIRASSSNVWPRSAAAANFSDGICVFRVSSRRAAWSLLTAKALESC